MTDSIALPATDPLEEMSEQQWHLVNDEISTETTTAAEPIAIEPPALRSEDSESDSRCAG